MVLVDLPPDELLQRLKAGKVYLPQQAARAVRNFFRKGNLIALRELALRRTADRVDDEMLQYRRNAVGGAGVADARGAAAVHRPATSARRSWCAARRAWPAQLDVPWHCVYVETPRLQRLPDAARSACCRCSSWRRTLAPNTATLAGDIAGRRRSSSTRTSTTCPRVVLGRDTGRWSPPWRDTLAEAVGVLGAGSRPDPDRAAAARDARRPAATGRARRRRRRPQRRWHGGRTPGARVVCAAATLRDRAAARVLRAGQHRDGVPARGGRSSRCASAAGRRCWRRSSAWRRSTFFYVPPRFSFSVSATCSTC